MNLSLEILHISNHNFGIILQSTQKIFTFATSLVPKYGFFPWDEKGMPCLAHRSLRRREFGNSSRCCDPQFRGWPKPLFLTEEWEGASYPGRVRRPASDKGLFLLTNPKTDLQPAVNRKLIILRLNSYPQYRLLQSDF